MKRNETVLVYAVTGLLLVILLVAVVFGDRGPARASTKGPTGPDVRELAGLTPAKPDAPGKSGGVEVPGLPGEGTNPGTGKAGDGKTAGGVPEGGPNAGPDGDAGGSKAGDSKAGASKASSTTPDSKPEASPAGSGAGSSVAGSPAADNSDSTGGGESDPGVGDLIQPAAPAKSGDRRPVALSATMDAMEQKLQLTLGSSRRSGSYRVVQSRRGDSLRELVIRWCGDTESMQIVEVLNESIVDGKLAYGQEVMVPWVDAAPLLEAHKARKIRGAKVEAAKGALYKLQKGDSLWNLAKARVAKNKIPGWLKQFQALNPEITDPSVLIAGQMVRLPPAK